MRGSCFRQKVFIHCTVGRGLTFWPRGPEKRAFFPKFVAKWSTILDFAPSPFWKSLPSLFLKSLLRSYQGVQLGPARCREEYDGFLSNLITTRWRVTTRLDKFPAGVEDVKHHRNFSVRQALMDPTPTRKPGKEHFPVKEKSGNFEQTGQFYTKYWKNWWIFGN